MKSNTVTKTLYLVRHTNAEAGTEAINDIDRPISEKGQKKAQKVCRKLKSKISEASPTFVSSPAKRAFETAEIFHAHFGDPTTTIETLDWLYQEFDTQMLIDYVMLVDSQQVWCFGHIPTFLNLLRKLGDKQLKKFPKSMAAGIELTFEKKDESLVFKHSKLVFIVNPKVF